MSIQQLEPGVELCGRFKLIEKLGVGGHGEVWRALDQQRAQELALKVLHPQIAQAPAAWEALRREYQIAQRLAHRGILEVYEPLRDDTATVLPMTLATGDLRRLRGEPYTRVVPVLIEIAAALAHAHERGVVHRDLKPSNVLIDDEGHIKVSDFGVAALDQQTATGASGSPFSVSPQQFAGAPSSPSDDIYGLGALAYELLSGYPPFYPNFDANALLHVPAPPLMPIHALPPSLAILVMRMLRKGPDERPASMTGVVDALHAALLDTLGVPDTVLDSEAPAVVAGPAVAASRPRRDPIDESTNDTPRLADDWQSAAAAAPEPAARAARAAGGRLGWVLGGTSVVLLLGAVFYWLPRYAQQRDTPHSAAATSSAAVADPAAMSGIAGAQRYAAAHARYDKALADLEARGAGIWGGVAFASAKFLASDAAAAVAAGQADLGLNRIDTATRRLERVAAQADAALQSLLAEGERALLAGQTDAARQAFELAVRINPADERAKAALQRAGGLATVLPALAEAETALAAGDNARAITAFGVVLTADPQNARARAGLAQARAAGGDDRYARALGEAQAALHDGRLSDARDAFDRARALKPQAPEIQAGLQQLQTISVSEDAGSARARIAALESQERWAEAQGAYDNLLRADPSLQYARDGKARVTPRVELAAALQNLIDKPTRMAGDEVRAEAQALLQRAREQKPLGPVLRSQIARLELLLPEFEKTVAIVLESDGLTAVELRRVGVLGSFERRELQLKPGTYTLIGTRTGFRDVRREMTVAPGQPPAALQIRCNEPI